MSDSNAGEGGGEQGRPVKTDDSRMDESGSQEAVAQQPLREHHFSLFGTSAQAEGSASSASLGVEGQQPEIASGFREENVVEFGEGSSVVPETQQSTGSDAVTSTDVDELRRHKVQLEQELFIASEELSTSQSKITNLNQLVESQKNELDLLGKDRSQRMVVMRELEAERDRIMLAKNESEQKAELLLRQKEDFESKVNRLTRDKNILTSDVHSLKTELEKMAQKNVLLEAKVDEVNKDRRLFEFEKERWAQEKEIYLHNKEWFMNEIRDRDTKLTVLKIESLRLTGELQAEKASLSEDSEAIRIELNKAKTLVNDREEQINELNKKIREVLEERSAKVNKLEEELLTSERLISVYKEASEEAERNLQELSADFDERGKLLEEAKEAYQSLREKLDEQQSQFAEEVNERNEKIMALNDELSKANELLKSKHRLSLTDDEVAELSPAAAAASALIKSGVSLTAIYREHSRVVAELEAAKAETARLEEHLSEFVDDLERRAPVLAQQRAEYERLNELCSALRLQLQSADEERQRLVSARDAASRELAYTKAELERTQRDCDDLSKQVRHLLHASEVNRAWSTRDSDSPPMSDEDRDILWVSIGELQKVNQKLMSDLRSVKANHQQMMEEANEAEITRLSEALDEAAKKLDTLKEHNDKQNMIIEKLQEQRDTYKQLAVEKRLPEQTTEAAKELSEAKELITQVRSQAERSERCLELYRDEKQKSDKILQDRIDQQFALLSELRTTNGKLEADIEQQRQAQMSLTKQSEADATELNLVREKLAKAETERKTLEVRLRNTETQLFESRGEIGKYKSELSALNEQISSLRSSEARLHQELFIVRESVYSNEKMSATLQQLQSRLDRSEEEKLRQLEDQLNVIRNENDSMKTFISEITEQHRIVSLDLKMTSNKVTTERDQALASKKSAEDRLTWKENEFAELQAKYDTLMKQLSAPDASLDTTAEGCRKEAQQLRNKNNYLENQLKDVKAELEGVNKKLAIREKEIEQMTKLSSNVEATLMEQNTSSAAELNSLKSMLDLVKKQLDDSTNTVTQLRLDCSRLEQRHSEEMSRCEQIKLEAQRNIAEVEKRLTISEAKRVDAERRAESVANQLCRFEGEMKVLEDDRRSLKEEIAKLEDGLKGTERDLKTAEALRVEDESRMEETQKNYQTEIAMLRVEKLRLEESLKEAQTEITSHNNKIEVLNANMIKLSQRNAFLERSSAAEEGSVGEAAGHSANALGDVIKYLQNENQQAMERTLNAELQWKRLQAQVSDLEERRVKLEDDLKKTRAEAEAGVRALAEKSEMVARLSLLEDVQRENGTLKSRIEVATTKEEQLTKKVNNMEGQIKNLEAEKAGDKTKLQNLTTDVQNFRKEAESWKERHAESMTALTKIGPEKVVTLTGEIEALKRQVAAATMECDSGKKLLEETKQKYTGELNRVNMTVQQLRVLAKSYKSKTLTLTDENQALRKQLEEGKPAAEPATVKAEPATESESNELSSLKQQLLSARLEIEKYKQKLSSAAPRTGWPVEAAANAASPSKGPSVLQAQMKQIESLSTLNKDLKNQLESLANRFKESQDELTKVKNDYEELLSAQEALKAEKETKEELRFRLNSITSMMTKKDAEMAKLREEIEKLKQELEESKQKVKSLENALENCRRRAEVFEQRRSNELTAAEAAEASDRNAIFLPVPMVKPVSSSTSVISQCGSDSSTRSAPPFRALLASSSMQKHPTLDKGNEISLGATSDESIIRLGESAASAAREGERPGLAVSTTSEQQPSVASSSEKAGTSAVPSGANSSGIPDVGASASGSPTKSPFAAFTGFPRFSTGKAPFTSTSPTFVKAQQSNAVSQSSGIFSTMSSIAQQVKPAQQNVISGSGDGTNVISSSGTLTSTEAVGGLPSVLAGPTGAVSAGRKRQVPIISDQSSSMETGSDLQESVKRQRVSPSEQVSTSGRFLQQGSDARLDEEKCTAVEDDGAEQEQQESVETTTNPEDEGVGEDFLEDEDRNMEEGQLEQVRVQIGHDNEVEEGDVEPIGDEGEEEGYQEEMEGEAGDEEAPEDEQGREEVYLDETLEGGDEEFEDEMEEDEDYEDEDDYEDVEEDIPDIRTARAAAMASRSQRILPQHQADDDDVIVIEDDEEEDEVSHSQSPADQSTDEADEGPRAPLFRPDTSSEPNGAERENDIEDGEMRMRARASQGSAEGSDHLELQRLRRSSDSARLGGDRSMGEGGISGTRKGDADVSSVPTGEMELSRADTTANSSGVADALLPSQQGASRDSSPYVVNIESDSRGASSTVAPTLAAVEDEGIVGESPRLMIGEDEEGGNEVAEEEQAAKAATEKRAPQTDDEAGVLEPSTSGDIRQRRTRILYPDVDEPSSSSNDRMRGMPPNTRGRGVWPYKARRSQPRRRP